LACYALGPLASAAQYSCRREPCTGRSAWLPLGEVHRSSLHPPAAAPPPSPGPARYLFARYHRLPALRHVHLLMNVLHRDVLVSARSLALKREQALLIGG